MKIILSVTGSISAYKSIDLARGLVNNGHEVKVILSAGAIKFVVPKIYSYLGALETYIATDDFENKGVLHVELARWCDSFVIAPLSANSLSRLVAGEASDLMTSVFLALEKTKPILIFPAMNTEMLSHPFVEENFLKISKLKSLKNVFICPTEYGVLACNDEGAGKLPSVEEIIELVESMKIENLNNQDKKIVITTGATISPLDPVRYLTNSASGITGFELAKSFLQFNFKVVVIAGINSTSKLKTLTKHPSFKLIHIKTVDEMYTSVHREINDAFCFVSSAAVSDIEFNYTDSKIKKDEISDSLKIHAAKDILKSVIELKKAELKIIGFAAETDLSDKVLAKKLESKPVDLLIGTLVNNGSNNLPVTGFNNSNAHYKIITSKDTVFEGDLKKSELGKLIIKRITS